LTKQIWEISASVGFIKKKEKVHIYEGWNFNSGNYLFTTDIK